MNSVSQSLLISVLVETSLAMAVVVGVWSFFAIRRRRRDVAAAQRLVETVRREEPAHLARVRDFVARIHQGQNASPIAERLLEGERDFYKKFIQIYLTRNASAFATLPDLVNLLGEAYRQLLSQAEGIAAAPSTAFAESSRYLGEEDPSTVQELLSLREEHGRLQEKFQITLDTMHRMIQEYASMYGKSCSALSQTTSDQILEALLTVNNANSGTSPVEERGFSTPIVPDVYDPDVEMLGAPEPHMPVAPMMPDMSEMGMSEEAEEPLGSVLAQPLEEDWAHSETPALLGESESVEDTDASFLLDHPDQADQAEEPPSGSEGFPLGLSMEENSIESLMEGLLEPTKSDPFKDPFAEALFESPKGEEPVAETEEFSWDNALLATDASDFDVLQLEEVSVAGSPKPVSDSTDHLRTMVRAAEESWRGAGVEPSRKR